MNETEEKKKVLVCETYKKINNAYPKLYLLPLKDDEKYGTLFLGSCSEYEMPTENFSDTVWRFCENGGVERARITNESMSYLNFRKTPYKFASRIEEKTMEELFGHYTYKYNKTLEKYQSNNRPRRLQRFVSKHPQMERLKRIAFDPKKVAGILLAAGISVSALGFAGQPKDNSTVIPENLATDVHIQEMAQMPSNYENDMNLDFLQNVEESTVLNTQETQSTSEKVQVTRNYT